MLPLRCRSLKVYHTMLSRRPGTIMLGAIIFDFDGIIVDTEPTIYQVFREMAEREGWPLSEQEYFGRYLALHDRALIHDLFESHGRKLRPGRLEELMQWKTGRYMERVKDGLPALPGAVEFIEKVSAQYPLAIATGSIRQEVEHLLKKLDLLPKFPILISADQFGPSKPDPECFLMALELLRKLPGTAGNGLKAAYCLVIEDSPAGVDGAHRAGMKCLGLAHSCPLEQLAEADWRAQGYEELDWEAIVRRFSRNPNR